MKNLRGIYGQTLKVRKKIARLLEEESQQFGNEFIEQHRQPIRTLDRNGKCQDLLKIWRNKDYLVQLYKNGNWLRLSINRSKYDPVRDCWYGNISWDELMIIKGAVGFDDYDAIEIYPKKDDIIYVTYMRHLFIIPENITLDCIWRKNIH